MTDNFATCFCNNGVRIHTLKTVNMSLTSNYVYVTTVTLCALSFKLIVNHRHFAKLRLIPK